VTGIRRAKFDPKREGVPRAVSIRRVRLGEISDITVCEVSGHLVRVSVDIDFVWGGNPGRYAYVPLGEVWIEAELEKDDVSGTIVHEIVEENLMRVKGLSYAEAHQRANDYEYIARKYEALTGEKAIELAKQIVSEKLGKPTPRISWRA
jgi:hypothetical protein